MKVFEVKLKEKLIGDPILLATGEHKFTRVAGEDVKTIDLMPGDTINVPVQLGLGLGSMDFECTVLEVVETLYTAKADGMSFLIKKH